MEQYLIEDVIVFSPTEKKLLNAHTSQEVILPLVTTEILTLVLSMRGEVVTRDTIFTHIIEPHGSASTNNNLNQYIMNLRKQLLFLDLKPALSKPFRELAL